MTIDMISMVTLSIFVVALLAAAARRRQATAFAGEAPNQSRVYCDPDLPDTDSRLLRLRPRRGS